MQPDKRFIHHPLHGSDPTIMRSLIAFCDRSSTQAGLMTSIALIRSKRPQSTLDGTPATSVDLRLAQSRVCTSVSAPSQASQATETSVVDPLGAASNTAALKHPSHRFVRSPGQAVRFRVFGREKLLFLRHAALLWRNRSLLFLKSLLANY